MAFGRAIVLPSESCAWRSCPLPGEHQGHNDLPTEAEINVHDSLDEKWAVEHLLGRTAAEIQKEFEDNIRYLGEALMTIGPVACAYYGRAAIDAAWNRAKDNGDGGALGSLVSILQLRFECNAWDVGDQPGFTGAVLSLCERVESECGSFGVKAKSYRHLRQGFRDLHEKLGGPKAVPVVPSRSIAAGLLTESELIINDSFDEREALRTFRGLSLEEVHELFARGAWRVASQLTELGPIAFAYYLPAAIAGARSPAAEGLTDTPSSELFLPLRDRAEQEYSLHQMLPLQLDAGMLERLPELLELFEFLENEPPFVFDYKGLIEDDDDDRAEFYRMFRRQLEQARDRLPRPAMLADGTEPEFETLEMSANAMVFLPEAAPAEREEFLHWYTNATDWKAGRGYEDPDVCDPRLRAWLDDMVLEIAPFAGPLARTVDDETRQADFCCDQAFIYFTASCDDPLPVWELAETLAAKHGLGLFWVACDAGEVNLPDGEGGLPVVHQRE